MRSIAFIGAGKVGSSLAHYFAQHGYPVVGVWDKEAPLARIPRKAQVIFITVPDDLIAPVWKSLAPYLTEEHWVFHCSGAADSNLLSPNPQKSATYSLDPMLAFSQESQSISEIAEAAFTLEGGGELPAVLAYFAKLPNPIAILSLQEKVRYHAACVMLTNHLIALVSSGIELLEECGLPADFSKTAWSTLVRQNTANLLIKGPQAALTGPIQRNDLGTVAKHLDLLKGDQKLLYQLLSARLLPLAKAQQPTQDFSSLERILQR